MGRNIEVFSEHIAGLDFYFNPAMVDPSKAPHVRNVLQDALKALEGYAAKFLTGCSIPSRNRLTSSEVRPLRPDLDRNMSLVVDGAMGTNDIPTRSTNVRFRGQGDIRSTSLDVRY